MQIGVDIFGSDFLHYGSFGVPGLDRFETRLQLLAYGRFLLGACMFIKRMGALECIGEICWWHFPVLETTTARSYPKKPSLLSHILDAASTVKLYLVRLLDKHQIQFHAPDPRRTLANMRKFMWLVEARNIQIRTDLFIIDGELKDNIILLES